MKTGIGEGIALKCALAAFSFAAGFAAPAATAEEDLDVKDGVHGYTPKNYVQPPEPEVRISSPGRRFAESASASACVPQVI